MRRFPLRDGKDIPVWALTTSGQMTTKSVYGFLKDRPEMQNIVYKKIWHSKLPPRASLFCWKLLKHAVPVDRRIQECGISLVSKCVCCPRSPEAEDVNHLFIEGDIAKMMWAKFSAIINPGCLEINSVIDRLIFAANGAQLSKPEGLTTLASVAVILWSIWKARCQLKFEGVKPQLNNLCSQAAEDIKFIMDSTTFKSRAGVLLMQGLKGMGIEVHSQNTKFVIVRWLPPMTGYALNVDGASRSYYVLNYINRDSK